jgi:hypothetical protein
MRSNTIADFPTPDTPENRTGFVTSRLISIRKLNLVESSVGTMRAKNGEPGL